MHRQHLQFTTNGRSITEITDAVQQAVSEADCQQGLCHLFIAHTSASLTICENADPQVRSDLERFMQRLIPDGDPLFKHTAEGPDDMPAHVRSILTQTSLTIPVENSQLLLGTCKPSTYGNIAWDTLTAGLL